MSNAPERTPSDYPVLLRSLPAVDGGGYLAMVPDLPRCVSDGDTTCSGVRERAGGDRGIATAVDIGPPIPDPSPQPPEFLKKLANPPHPIRH